MPRSFFNRRAFVARAARSILGVGAMPVLSGLANSASAARRVSSPDASAKSVIYLFMNGGMSHLDTFDTKPGAKTQGPVESIATSADGVQVSQYFPKLAKQMHHVAVINSMNSNQGAHSQGRYFMHTSYALRGTTKHPDMGAWSSVFLEKTNQKLPANVKIGGATDGLGGGFLESEFAALPIGDPNAGLQHSTLPDGMSENRFQRRLKRLKKMNAQYTQHHNNKTTRAYAAMYDEAVALMHSEDLAVFDLTREPDHVRDDYGRNPFGQACLLARRLAENGVHFIEVENGGWDTHGDNFNRVQTLGADLDQALAALLADLSARGSLDETLVVLATEFGRTPDIQTERDMGRNHYPQAFTCLLAGGGIRGGIKYGKTDEEGREVTVNRVAVPDFNATIAHAMGIPLDVETISPDRRPFKVADDGTPVLDLFG